LDTFWKRISSYSHYSPVQHTWFDQLLTGWNMDYNPVYGFVDALTRIYSPYVYNPLNISPLRDVLESCVNFDEMKHCSSMKVFVSATNVRTGKAKVFSCTHITADTLMASACLPFLSQAVKVGEEYYWDGGYSGNPVIYPLIYHSNCKDIVLVQINPLE